MDNPFKPGDRVRLIQPVHGGVLVVGNEYVAEMYDERKQAGHAKHHRAYVWITDDRGGYDGWNPDRFEPADAVPAHEVPQYAVWE
jgi:hypothetical protein